MLRIGDGFFLNLDIVVVSVGCLALRAVTLAVAVASSFLRYRSRVRFASCVSDREGQDAASEATLAPFV